MYNNLLKSPIYINKIHSKLDFFVHFQEENMTTIKEAKDLPKEEASMDKIEKGILEDGKGDDI